MANQSLNGLAVAVLVDDGFEQSELLKPREALDAAGATTRVVSPKDGRVRGWSHAEWGEQVKVDVPLEQARADDYGALLLPGGVMNPDKLRMNPKAVAFVKAFFDAGKPVAAICHAGWTLIEAGAVQGKTMTSWPSLRTDLENAGATWVDEVVHVDSSAGWSLITSRNPDDVEAFTEALVGLIEGRSSASPAETRSEPVA